MAVVLNAEPTQPWWRHGLVWLVVGLPLSAVVAGSVTAVIAVRGADEEVERPAVVQQRVDAKDPAAPALKARNHAATPLRGTP